MYNQLIYFIVVLILFSLQQPEKASGVSHSNALYIAVFFLAFVFYCKATFEKFLRRALRGLSPSFFVRRYYLLQARLSVLALGFLVLDIYLFQLKHFLRIIPWFDTSSTISGLVGLAIYLIHMGVIWYYGQPAYRAVLGSSVSRLSFLRGNLSFSFVILLPWCLISMVVDLFESIRVPAYIGSDLGEYLVVVLAMIGFVFLAPGRSCVCGDANRSPITT